MVNPKPLVLPVADDPPCEPVSEADLAPLVAAEATEQKLSPGLIRAVISRESAFYPCAVSAEGAQGLMQLMPDMIAQFSVRDPFDAKQSIHAGSQYLKQLLDRYKGDLPKALGAYNAGPTAVDEAKGVPDIPETREYVRAILKSLEEKP
jgi:soluble lytic murein transglycosylase